MIIVKIKYPDGKSLPGMEPIDEIRFTHWGTLMRHFNLIFRNNVPFELVDIAGHDTINARVLQAAGIAACSMPECEDHWNENGLFHATTDRSPKQTPLEFCTAINRRVKARQGVL